MVHRINSRGDETNGVDPRDEAPKLTAEIAARAQLAIDGQVIRKANPRGRPRKPEETKVAISIRLNPATLAYFRSTGPGWQSLIEEVLSEFVRNCASGENQMLQPLIKPPPAVSPRPESVMIDIALDDRGRLGAKRHISVRNDAIDTYLSCNPSMRPPDGSRESFVRENLPYILRRAVQLEAAKKVIPDLPIDAPRGTGLSDLIFIWNGEL